MPETRACIAVWGGQARPKNTAQEDDGEEDIQSRTVNGRNLDTSQVPPARPCMYRVRTLQRGVCVRARCGATLAAPAKRHVQHCRHCRIACCKPLPACALAYVCKNLRLFRGFPRRLAAFCVCNCTLDHLVWPLPRLRCLLPDIPASTHYIH